MASVWEAVAPGRQVHTFLPQISLPPRLDPGHAFHIATTRRGKSCRGKRPAFAPSHSMPCHIGAIPPRTPSSCLQCRGQPSSHDRVSSDQSAPSRGRHSTPNCMMMAVAGWKAGARRDGRGVGCDPPRHPPVLGCGQQEERDAVPSEIASG